MTLEPGCTLADTGDLARRVGAFHGGVAVVIRHSIREPIRDPDTTFSIPLTEEGKAEARRFGAMLAARESMSLYHSPVPRCVDTALCIRDGFESVGGCMKLVGAEEALRCGFLHDDRVVFDIFERVGYGRFVRMWFSGELPPEAIGPPAKALDSLLAHLAGGGDDGITLHVAHDWHLLLLMSAVQDMRLYEGPWPRFLEGVIVEKAGGRPVPLAGGAMF